MGDALRALAGPAKLPAPELLVVADLVMLAMYGRELGRESRKARLEVGARRTVNKSADGKREES